MKQERRPRPLSRADLLACIREDIAALQETRDGLKSTVELANDRVWDMPAPRALPRSLGHDLETALDLVDAAIVGLKVSRGRLLRPRRRRG